jgi:hypothetical protein
MIVWLGCNNGGHVISRSGKRVKHIVFAYNAHPSCKIKILDKIPRIMHKKYKTKLEDIKEVLRIPYKWFLLGSQISRFSSKLVELFLAVLNFHDSESLLK